MIILDKPYVSDFLIETIQRNQIPVLKSHFSETLFKKYNTFFEEDRAIQAIIHQKELLYTNSENALGWIGENLSETDLPKQIELFKNKEKFRLLISKMYPKFYFKKIAFSTLASFDINSIQMPFVVKPNIGFFSMGVYIIKTKSDWNKALIALEEEIQSVNNIYPKQVMDATEFIIESYIGGKEYAIDCYFNAESKPILLNILEHQFSSIEDVSDRLYFTSTLIIKNLKNKVLQFLEQLNALAGLRNFPLHIEIRIDNDKIIPIEGNPLRFGGWCTTADLAYHAYGFNPYLYFFKQEEPNWDAIIKRKDDATYSIVILNNATGYDAFQIQSFNFEKLISTFEKVIELRKIDYHKFPLFGFLFTKTSKDNFRELEQVLTSDLKRFVQLKNR